MTHESHCLFSVNLQHGGTRFKILFGPLYSGNRNLSEMLSPTGFELAHCWSMYSALPTVTVTVRAAVHGPSLSAHFDIIYRPGRQCRPTVGRYFDAIFVSQHVGGNCRSVC